MMDASAVFSCILLLLTTRCSFALLSSPSGGFWCHPKTFRQQLKRERSKYTLSLHLYNKFHNYAWEKMHYDDDNSLLSTVPDSLKTNSSPVKGSPDGASVVANIRSISGLRRSENAPAAQAQAIRLARSAFLETQTSSSEALISPMTIHVLNLVLFPATHVRDPSTNAYLGLPIFGADIVTLPGNKHLVALDFQPVLPLNEEGGSSRNGLFPERYSHLETKLKSIHARYQNNDTPSEALLPWGGDIPPQAIRWFSPYALWTRFGDEKAIETVSTTVWDAYREYVDLYFELIDAVQSDLDNGNLNIIVQKESEEEDVVGGEEEEYHKNLASSNPVLNGQREYLEYRRINDPARPMLQRLYGKEWAEELIDNVLFPNL